MIAARVWIGFLAVSLAMAIGCGAPAIGGGGGAPSQTGASIQANPNPVPAGGQLGSTTVIWKTGDGSQGQVYVSEDGGPDNLFDAGTEGNKEAPWIRTGSTYEFRLYAGSEHKSQLASVQVTRSR
jgi:hypothetical protein